MKTSIKERKRIPHNADDYCKHLKIYKLRIFTRNNKSLLRQGVFFQQENDIQDRYNRNPRNNVFNFNIRGAA